MNTKMFSGKYLKTYLQFLSSEGGRALYKEVLPAYVLIVIATSIYLFMEKSSPMICFNVFLFLLGIPICAIGYNFVTISSRARSSSNKNIKINSGTITITNLKTNQSHTYSDMHIRYFQGSYIDFIDKANIFSGHALFGNKNFLDEVIDNLLKNGFKISYYPEKG